MKFLNLNIGLSVIQLVSLASSLLTQILLARQIGPGRSLDQFFGSIGFASAVIGGISVAATYIVPSHLQRKAGAAAQAKAAGDALLIMLVTALGLSVPSLVIYIFNQKQQEPDNVSAELISLVVCAWGSAIISVVVATLSAIGITHQRVVAPIVLSVMPSLSAVAYLLAASPVNVQTVALAQLLGVTLQAMSLGYLLRAYWQMHWPSLVTIHRLLTNIPVGALGAVCFTGYSGIDAIIAPSIGAGVLSHQALAQRLVIAFGAVLSAGPFQLAPSKVVELLKKGDRLGVRNYVIKSAVVMVGACTVAAAATPTVGRFAIALAFQRGIFSSVDTTAVTGVVCILLLGAGPMLAAAVTFRALHAMHRPWTVALLSVFWLVLYLTLSLMFTTPLGPLALAAAYAAAWICVLALALLVLVRNLSLAPVFADATEHSSRSSDNS